MKTEKINNEWRLDRIEINFKRGYDFEKDPEKRMDRYEGVIRFENGESEMFQFRVKPDMSRKYIDLIAVDIVTAATGLGERLKESLGLNQ